MTLKILCWVDSQLIHFGIAKSLQEKLNCDIFAILDVRPNSKEFFLKQKLVNFKKTWFYRDKVSNLETEPDLPYLEEFEKKYKINLWQLAYGEKTFYKYNEYYKFSYKEILSIFEAECKLFEEILNEIQPDLLIMKTADWHQNFLLCKLCMSQNIPTLMLYNTRFGKRSAIDVDFDRIDTFIKNQNDITNKNPEELREYIKKFDVSNQISEFKKGYRSSSSSYLKAAIKFFLTLSSKEYKKYYGNFGRTKSNIFFKHLNSIIKKSQRSAFIDKHFITKIDSKAPFVYFPLHAEPERTLNFDAPFHLNQITVITQIARSLPVSHKLYVKEHPMMSVQGWRNISYYKEILNLPNVVLVHPSVTSEKMLKECSLVVTITGTAGLEASFFEKPTLIFTDTSYSHLPFIIKVNDVNKLPELIKSTLEKKFDFSKLNEYVNLFDNNSFNFDYTGMIVDFSKEFYYGGFLSDVEISEENMKRFLDEHILIFDQLAQEHIKKINLKQKND